MPQYRPIFFRIQQPFVGYLLACQISQQPVFVGRGTVKYGMNVVCVVIVAEIQQVLLQVPGIPEEDLIEKFLTTGSNQPFHERI